MTIQSRTYNNGAILEYIYTISPEVGDTFQQHVFILVATGEILTELPLYLNEDVNSINSFQGVCCNVIEETCEGWITEDESCWITASGASWALP